MKKFIAAAAVRSGTVATRPRPGDPRLDPGGVSGRLVLAGEQQRRGDLQAWRVQAQGWFLEHRSHDPRHGPPIVRFRQWDGEDGTLNMRMLCTDFEEEEPSMYGARLNLRPGKKIELIIEPMDQQ